MYNQPLHHMDLAILLAQLQAAHFISTLTKVLPYAYLLQSKSIDFSEF